MNDKKIIREHFRELVFKRDKYKCVVPHCNKDAVDAHHIIERALWNDEKEMGGYIVDNGASVCELHHKHAESNFIPPQALRQWAGIKQRVLPMQLNTDIYYDKWGVPLAFPNRTLVKYPHTRYLTFSPSNDKSDVDECGFIQTEHLCDKPLVFTIKMDGSNVKMTSEIVTARNGHSADHKSFDFIKARHSKFKHLIPEHISVFGEWLYAKHSIHYTNNIALNELIQVFGVYDYKTQLWYGWEDVEKFANSIGLKTVPVVGYNTYNNELNASEHKGSKNNRILNWNIEREITKIGEDIISKGHEGLVIRSMYPFQWSQFGENVGKFVRPNHVQTDKHWSKTAIVKNEVK